jgi:ribonuclease Z
MRRIIAIAALVFLCIPMPSQAQDIKVTLLGTGCPAPVMNRFGSSILVEAAGQALLFDAGRGALQRLTQARVPWQNVRGVFLTHLHSDHVVGLPDLLLTGWLTTPKRAVSPAVLGPSGTAQMIHHLRQAFAEDIRIRVANEHADSAGIALGGKDISDGVVYDESGLKVTAFGVDHAPAMAALGYRIDYAGRSVVLSGDTRPSDDLVRHAAGADVLIHEVIVPETLRRIGIPADRIEDIISIHTTPEQAGQVFARATPKLAVYSHICPPAATAQDVLPLTRTTYPGRVEMGEDLMVIEVGPTIQVRRPLPLVP